jgi:hypothetical protein
MLAMPRMRELRSKHDLPDWMHELPGFDLLEERTDPAGVDDGMWRFNLVLPKDMSGLAEHIDPLITLAVLAAGIAQVEDKIGEVVRFTRTEGRSWTQIGEALGMSKQAAWERFSGED